MSLTNAFTHGLNSAISINLGSLDEVEFQRMISLERRRTSRSQKSFLLMLIDAQQFANVAEGRLCLKKILSALPRLVRETDVFGWYKDNAVIGVMFTEMTLDSTSIASIITPRMHRALKGLLNPRQFDQVGVSFRFLPEPKQNPLPSYSAIPANELPATSAVSSLF